MPKRSTIPRFWQWASGISLLIAALAAAGISLAINFEAGMAVHLSIAAMLALSDIGKILIPVVCQGIGWTLQSRATYLVVSVASVVCAFIFIESKFEKQQAEATNQVTIAKNAEQRIAELRRSLASARQMAAEEAKRGGCGPNCLALNDRTSKLETALSEAVAARKGIAPKGASLSEGRALILTLLGLTAMELLSHLAGAAASMIGQAMRTPKPIAKPKRKAKARKKAPAKPKKIDWTKPDTYTIPRTKTGKADMRTKAARRLKEAAYGTETV